MKIVLLGATGHIGSAILQEALARGHDVVAVVRDRSRLSASHAKLNVVEGDASRPDALTATLKGADAIVASLSARRDGDHAQLPKNAAALLDAAQNAGVKRLAWVGGAGSLETSPGVRVMDDPNFPAAWKPEAEAQALALETFRASKSGVDWTYVSPAALIEPGEKTGRYRIGSDQLLVDANGKSRITIDDYAAALLDRVEKGDAARKRITVAY